VNKQGEIIGLAHIGIHTDNLQESIEFYTDVLGFTLDHTADLHGGGVRLAFLNLGSCIVELINIADKNVAASRQAGVIDHLALGVKDISSLVQRSRTEVLPTKQKNPRTYQSKKVPRTSSSWVLAAKGWSSLSIYR